MYGLIFHQVHVHNCSNTPGDICSRTKGLYMCGLAVQEVYTNNAIYSALHNKCGNTSDDVCTRRKRLCIHGWTVTGQKSHYPPANHYAIHL